MKNKKYIDIIKKEFITPEEFEVLNKVCILEKTNRSIEGYAEILWVWQDYTGFVYLK